MSTVPEVVVAVHCGLVTFGLTLVTNVCAMDPDQQQADGLEVICLTREMLLVLFICRYNCIVIEYHILYNYYNVFNFENNILPIFAIFHTM